MKSLPGNSLAAMRATLDAGRTDPLELAEAAREAVLRSDAEDPPLHAFLSLSEPSRLRRHAAEAAERLGDGAAPLAGIPVAIKDNICTLEAPTTCGSRMLEGYRAPYEATVVRRLRAAGALILGKTNMDEFAMGSSTENSAFGPTRNPHDRERVPGGSSGGSAAAVAAGLVPAALGSDTGGSVRQPAAFCGVVGLRPTYGRVSRYGLVAFASSLDQIGVFAGTVPDAATVLGLIAGPDPFDATTAGRPAPRFGEVQAEEGARLDGLVVGVPAEYFPSDLDRDVSRLCRNAIDVIADLGAEVREISLPHLDYAVPVYYLVADAEASSNLARYDGVRYGHRDPEADSTWAVYGRSRGRGFGDEVKRRVVLGAYALSAGYSEEYYARALWGRRRIARDFQGVFDGGIQVVFTPTTPTPAFRLGERVGDPVAMYESDLFTVPASLAGLPALSLPVGAASGLPVGGQLIGRRFDEGTVVRAAHALEHALEGAAGP